MSIPTPPPPQSQPPPPPPDNQKPTLTPRPPPIVFPPQRPPQNPIYQQQQQQLRLPTSNPNPNYPQLARRHDPYSPHLRYPGNTSSGPGPGRGWPAPSSSRGGGAAAANNNNNSPRRPFVFSYPEPNPFFYRHPHIRPSSGSGPALFHNHNGVAGGGVMQPGGGGGGGGGRGGINVPSSQQQQQHHKVGGTSVSVLESNANGHKQQLRNNKDDVSVTIRDRKVRLNNNGSLYSLCRSWIRNGHPEEAQLHYPDNVKALPKPLPLAAVSVNSTDKKEGDKEEVDEDEVSVEQLSAKELLQRHVKRAKRIRSRLREERHERITRYKTRLALLLPPMVDQSPLKNETD